MNTNELKVGMWAAVATKGKRSYLGEVAAVDDDSVTIASMSYATGLPLYEDRYMYTYETKDITDFKYVTKDESFLDQWGNKIMPTEGLEGFVDYWNRLHGFED